MSPERLAHEQPASIALHGEEFMRAARAASAVASRGGKPGKGVLRLVAADGQLEVVASNHAASAVQIAKATIGGGEDGLDGEWWVDPGSFDEVASELYNPWGAQSDLRLFQQETADDELLYLAYGDWSGAAGLHEVDAPRVVGIDSTLENIQDAEYETFGEPDGYQLRGVAVGMAAAAHDVVLVHPSEDELTFVSDPWEQRGDEHRTWTIAAPGVDGTVEPTFVGSYLLEASTAAVRGTATARIDLGGDHLLHIAYQGVDTWTAPRIPQDDRPMEWSP